MKVFPPLAAMFLLMPVSISAFEVAVRSGEHSGFTRLVLDLPRQLDWTLDHTDRNAEIAFSEPGLTFDTSNAFTKIARERIGRISSDPKANILQIELNCDCELRVFPGPGNMLVVDVVGPINTGEESTTSRAISNPVDPEVAKPKLGFGTHRREQPLLFPNSTPALSFVEPLHEFRLGLGASLGQTNRAKSVDGNEVAAAAQRSQRIIGAQQRLIAQISRAATQGLLTVQPQHANQTEARISGLTVPAPLPMKEPTPLHSPPTLENVNLRAESSIDREQTQIQGVVSQTRNGGSCLSHIDLAIQKWGNGGTFGSQIGVLRAQLVGEFDRTETEIANDLVKLYLHFGFGAEATQALELIDKTRADTNILASMARIIERGFDSTPSPFNDLLECDSDAAFWAVLSMKTPPVSQHINTSAILRTINGLPPQMRSHLGPILSQRLLQSNEKDAAKSILRIIMRSASHPSPETQLAIATLELADGDPESATQSLNDAISTGSEISPNALVQLIDTLLDQNKPISPHFADLAGAYVQERRGDPIAQDLHRIQVLILANSENYAEALSELGKFKSSQSQAKYQELRSNTLATLTEQSDDLTFLEHILPQSLQSPESLRTASGDSIAGRLLTLGFADLAARFLSAKSNGPVSVNRRVLLAKLALALNRPRRAESEIAGMTDQGANSIRAAARSMAGDHQAAQELFAGLKDDQSVETAAWLGGNWPYLSNSGEPNIAAAAQLMIEERISTLRIPPLDIENPTETPTGTIGVLAKNREILESSSNARKVLTAILDLMAIDDDPLP